MAESDSRLNPMLRGIGFKMINDIITVKYIGEDDPLSLRSGKVYEARLLKKGWFGIVDEIKEEYAYPPEVFEVVNVSGGEMVASA